MALTLNEATTRLRRIINEAMPAMFLDTDLYDMISDAQQDLCADTDCLCGLTSFDLSDGVSSYTLPTGTQRILQAWYVDGDNYYPIEQADDVETNILFGTGKTTEGRPLTMVRRSVDTCDFLPVPSESNTCQIYRSYEPTAISLSADTFQVRDSWVRKGVLSLAAARCFEKTAEIDKANSYKAEYMYTVDEIKKVSVRWNVRSKPLSQYQTEQEQYRETLASVLT